TLAPTGLILSLRCPSALSALPSFPTRRSSDLFYRYLMLINTDSIDSGLCADHAASLSTSYEGTFKEGLASGSMFKAQVRSTKSRSEEHTSELQSRFDLVCRLLLEKRKSAKPAA